MLSGAGGSPKMCGCTRDCEPCSERNHAGVLQFYCKDPSRVDRLAGVGANPSASFWGNIASRSRGADRIRSRPAAVACQGGRQPFAAFSFLLPFRAAGGWPRETDHRDRGIFLIAAALSRRRSRW
jgi:hypothetical protein